MLPTWDPERLAEKIPFVISAVGGRRMGKSTLITHLLSRYAKRFDLVISFAGTAACSPQLGRLIENKWDVRFQFGEWNSELMTSLLAQQERLKKQGIQRQVAILVDDIVLSSKDEDEEMQPQPSKSVFPAGRFFQNLKVEGFFNEVVHDGANLFQIC